MDHCNTWFAGVSYDSNHVTISPKLPPQWNGMKFVMQMMGQTLNIQITQKYVKVKADHQNTKTCKVTIDGKGFALNSGEEQLVNYS